MMLFFCGNTFKDQSRELEKLLEENSRKLNKVEANLLIQKEITNKVESLFKCEECDYTFSNKQERRKHISVIQNLYDVTIMTKLSMKAGHMKYT